jgi:hypothetical protein
LSLLGEMKPSIVSIKAKPPSVNHDFISASQERFSKSYAGETFNFFTRRRPQYYDLGGGQVFDVKAYGT